MGLKRSLLIPLLGLLIFLGWLVFYANTDVLDGQNLHMSELSKTPVGGDFQVDSNEGKIALSDFKGNAVILYFGYTSCPDVCSTSLSKISLALQNLSQKERSQVKTLFVSLDPEHDSIEKLQDYVHYYHGSFIGSTATQAELKVITEQYAVTYRKVKKYTNNIGSTWLDHTSHYYIIDTSGELKASLPHETKAMEISKRIQEILGDL